jgi:hypothetical protein
MPLDEQLKSKDSKRRDKSNSNLKLMEIRNREDFNLYHSTPIIAVLT